jgi:hypothetical protein
MNADCFGKDPPKNSQGILTRLAGQQSITTSLKIRQIQTISKVQPLASYFATSQEALTNRSEIASP